MVTEESKADSKQSSSGTANSLVLSPIVVAKTEGNELPISGSTQQTQVSNNTETVSKSFYSFAQLSEALRDLPPGQFEAARDCCMRLRYPPTLAVLMQREKGNQLYESISTGPRAKHRSARSIHFEILPSHFEGTVVKLFDDEGAAAVRAEEDVAEEDPFRSESGKGSATMADCEYRILPLSTSAKRACHQRRTQGEDDGDLRVASDARADGFVSGISCTNF